MVEAYPLELLDVVFLPRRLEHGFLLLAQIRVFLNFGLVESVDDRILPLWHEDLLHFLLVFERYLPYRHTPVLLQIRPRCVNDGDIVFLIACIHASKEGLVPCAGACKSSCQPTFDGIGLGELRAVFQ